MLVTVCYNLFRLTWKNAGSVSSSCALWSHVRKHLQNEWSVHVPPLLESVKESFFSTEKSKILSRTFILPSSIKAPKQWSARAHWEHENFFRGNLLFAENFRRTNQTGHRRNWRGGHVAAIWDCEWFACFFPPPWSQPWPNSSAIWRHPWKRW